MAFGVLEKPVGTLDLLVFLLRNGRTSINEILAETGMSRDTFYGAVNRPTTLNLAYRDEQAGFPPYVYLGLTKSGEDLARALLPGADMLASTSVALESELARLERENNPKSIPRRLEILDLTSSKELCLGKWDSAQKKASRLMSLAKVAHFTEFEIKGRLTVGRVLRKRAKYEDAMRELADGTRLADEHGAAGIAAEFEYEIGMIFEDQSKWNEAAEHFRIAGENAARTNATLIAARIRSATARLMAKQGKFEESLHINEELVPELERLGADDDLPRIYTNIGTALIKLGKPDFPEWLTKALDAARKVGDIRMEAHALSSLAYHYFDTKQYKRAEADMKRGKAIFEDLGDKISLIGSELQLGNLYSEMARWSDSESHFDAALAIARETKSKFHEAYVFYNRGIMMERRNRKDAADALYVEARNIFLEIGSEAEAANVEKRRSQLTPSGTK